MTTGIFAPWSDSEDGPTGPLQPGDRAATTWHANAKTSERHYPCGDIMATTRETGAPEPFLTADGEGRAIWSEGTLMVIKADAETTGGASSTIDVLVPPGHETTFHVHHREDEQFYVLEGEVEFTVGEGAETVFRAGLHDTVFVPRDVPHGFRIVSEEACRMLVQLTPAGFERFFVAVGRPADALELPPPDAPDDSPSGVSSGDYGLESLGPIPR